MTLPAGTLPAGAKVTVNFTVNGEPVSATVETRKTLLDTLRDDLNYHGVHVGCEHGVCGACNITINGQLARSCLMLAFQAEGAEIRTIEGIEGPDGPSALQEAFCKHHAMQCGYCTPGMIMTITNLLENNPKPTEDELVDAVSGNLCRCTGYHQILEAAREVAGNERGPRS